MEPTGQDVYVSVLVLVVWMSGVVRCDSQINGA